MGNAFVMGQTMEMAMETMAITEIMEIMEIMVTMEIMATILTFMLLHKLQQSMEMAMDPMVMEMDLTEILMGQIMGMGPIVIVMDPMDQADQADPMDPMDLMDQMGFAGRSHVKFVSQ